MLVFLYLLALAAVVFVGRDALASMFL